MDLTEHKLYDVAIFSVVVNVFLCFACSAGIVVACVIRGNHSTGR